MTGLPPRSRRACLCVIIRTEPGPAALSLEARVGRAVDAAVARRRAELARIMGTSVAMIERHYGALLDGTGAAIASRLDTFDAAQATHKPPKANPPGRVSR